MDLKPFRLDIDDLINEFAKVLKTTSLPLISLL